MGGGNNPKHGLKNHSANNVSGRYRMTRDTRDNNGQPPKDANRSEVVVGPQPGEPLDQWRRARRTALIAAREAIAPESLTAAREAIDRHLRRAFADLGAGSIAFCWPYRNEYDARHLLAQLRREGATTLMPVVVKRGQPLIFRAWTPGEELARGPLGIPYPAAGEARVPDTVLLPVVGFDLGGYRLGYGGGFFDRTLEALESQGARPRVIGVGHELAQMDTIHPQPYDRPLDYMATERGIYERRDGVLRFIEPAGYSSPACLAGEIAPGYFGGSGTR